MIGINSFRQETDLKLSFSLEFLIRWFLIQVRGFISGLDIWSRFKDLFQVWISDPGLWIYFRFGYLIQVHGFVSGLDIWSRFMNLFQVWYLIQVHGFISGLDIWARFMDLFQVWISDPGSWIYLRFEYLIQNSWIYFRFGYLIQVQGFISGLDIWARFMNSFQVWISDSDSWICFRFGYLNQVQGFI